MMIEGLLSFLGGSVFRMVWGEVSSWYTKKQDHEFELERMRIQSDMEEKTHQRMQESLKLQSDLGIKLIEAKAETASLEEEAKAFTEAMKNAFVKTGYPFVDIWNGIIRPSAATISLLLWILKLHTQGWKMEDWDITLCGTILGFFFASRELSKRGK